jgi:hypothetical protein
MTDYSVKPTDSLFVDAKETPLTISDVVFYLRKAWQKTFNEEITKNQLAVLWAHTTIEVGHGAKLSKNFNFGNIKKKPNLKYTSYSCSEILNGKEEHFVPFHPQTFFLSFESATNGFEQYIKFLNSERYKPALAALKAGDPSAYGHQLKVCGYYTASEEFYTKALIKLTNQFLTNAAMLMAYQPKDWKEPETSSPAAASEPELPTLPGASETSQHLPIVVPDVTSVPVHQPTQEPVVKITSWFQAFVQFIMALLKIFKK